MSLREETFKGAGAQDRADPRGAELAGQKTFKVVGVQERRTFKETRTKLRRH